MVEPAVPLQVPTAAPAAGSEAAPGGAPTIEVPEISGTAPIEGSTGTVPAGGTAGGTVGTPSDDVTFGFDQDVTMTPFDLPPGGDAELRGLESALAEGEMRITNELDDPTEPPPPVEPAEYEFGEPVALDELDALTTPVAPARASGGSAPAEGVVAISGAPAPSGGSPGGADASVPWWSDPAIVGLGSNGEPLPRTLLFPDVGRDLRVSAADFNQTVLEQLGDPSGTELQRRRDDRVAEQRADHSDMLGRMAQDVQTMYQAPQVSEQLANVFTQMQTRFDGGTPDFSGVSPEALTAATRQVELRAESSFRPDPGPVRAYAAALGELATSTGELTPRQLDRLSGALDRSQALETEAVRLAQENAATSRLRVGDDAEVNEAVRFLRSICGDTVTANALCAPLDEGVVGRGRVTGQQRGQVPHGVLPPQVRHLVGNPLPLVQSIVDGSASPRAVLGLEQKIQEVNTMLTAVLPEGVPNELPRDSERRQMLDRATTARVNAIHAAREDPGSATAEAAYGDYLGAVSELLGVMGVERDGSGVVVPPPRGDEVEHSGDPLPGLASSEDAAGDAISMTLWNPWNDGPPLLQQLTRLPLRVVQPSEQAEVTSSAAEAPQEAEDRVEDGAESGADAEQEGRSGDGGGIVLAPQLERPVDPMEDITPGGLSDRPVELPDLNTPGRPVDPSEFDPNRARDLIPADPGATGQEVIPGRDEELERVLAPTGVPGLLTSPLYQEEPPTPDRTPEATPDATPDPSTAAAASPARGSTALRPDSPQVPVQQVAARYAPLPGGGQGVVVDEQRLSGTGNPRDTAGSLTTVQDQTGVQYVSVQPTRVANPDGTETVFIPRLPGERVGYNPTGDTAAVYRLSAGQSGRVTASTPVDQVRVRTSPGTTLQFNGGGGPNAVPGMAFRDRVYENPTLEEWTIHPASETDPVTGKRRITAQVPAGYEDRVDLAQDGVIRLRVPAGSRPVAVSQTVQAFTPYVPTPTYTPAPVATPAYTPAPVATPPTPTPTPQRTAPAPQRTPQRAPAAQPARPVAQPAPVAAPQNGAGRFLDNAREQGGRLLNSTTRAAQQAWNNQPATVQEVSGGVQVRFMDGRVGVYDPGNGNRISGAGPDWVHPMQIVTPGAALRELGTIGEGIGNVLQNLPPIPLPMPGGNPLNWAH